MHEQFSSSKLNIKCQNPFGNHNMVVHEWGDKKNTSVLLCLHGLTRSAKDFYFFARSLKKYFRVLAPDLVGRGESDWLENENLYQISQYINDINSMLIQLNIKRINFIGTSLGGLVGLLMASKIFDKNLNSFPFILADSSQVLANSDVCFDSLVINDFPASISVNSLFDLAEQIKYDANQIFSSFSQAEEYVKKISTEFGFHTDLQWKILTESYVKLSEESGTYKIHYDPKIVSQFKLYELMFRNDSNFGLFRMPDLNFWEFYDKIKCSTLLLRGKRSFILNKKIANEMTKRGPLPKLVEFDDVGHAPTLIHSEQLEVLKNFLMLKK